MVHSVAPAGTCQKAKMAASEWRNSALRFHLAKAGGVRGNYNVASQHQLDPHRISYSLHRSHNRLDRAFVQGERVDVAFRDWRDFSPRTKELRHVDACREMVALGAQNRHPEFVGVVELSHRV